MPVTSLAQALPYVNWILLVTLAVGSFSYVTLARQAGGVTNGYAGFMAFAASVLAALALWADSGLPLPSSLVIVGASMEIDLARRVSLAAFALLAFAQVFAIRRNSGEGLVAGLALAAGALTLIAAAVGWAPSLADSVPLLIQLAVLSAASGGALATLVLAHWYLVTPRLSERPLVVLTRLLTLTVCLQLALFVVWATLGGGPGQGAFDAFTGGQLFLVILRFVVSLLFALVLCWMALRTAQTRSMESATGLLYIDLAAILAGTIGAAALYVSSGLLV
ncbi:MAG TPA: hypothetical protein VMP67_11635 [Candidatus Limnocylindria bacterium]|nr:hypothetical protein [Candidatus Limnocylindria bacterium]